MVGGRDLDKMILSKQLCQLGMRVRCVSSGRDALTAVVSGVAPDIVLIDENLSDMRGTVLAASLRAAGARAAEIVLCTDQADQIALPDNGAVDLQLARPILRNSLLRTLAKHGRKGRRGNRPPPEPLAPRAIPSMPSAPQPRYREVNQMPSGQQRAAIAPPSVATASVRTSGRKMRVLTAEDNRTNQLVFRKIVKDLDIELVCAENGRQTVELFERVRPDLIFMDISMPEVDGIEATRRIRAREHEGEHVPIIALTAHALVGDKEEILDAGLDHYLTKPLKKIDIIQIIEAACPSECVPPVISHAAQ